MRILARTILVVLFFLGLTWFRLLAAPAKALGTIIQCQAALLDNSTAVVGANVYPGDVFQTEPGGILRLRLGTTQIYVLSSSAASLGESPSGISMTLTRGTAGFASPGPGVVEVRTPQAVIRTEATEPAHGQVTIEGPHILVISSYRGVLDVDVDGAIQVISAGHAYRMILDSDPQEAQGAGTKPAGTHSVKKKKPLCYAIALGAAAVAAYFIIDELTESPSGLDKN